ncbi:MAG: hypothetical protein AAFU64_14705, partial [Bacteroidota bacterium]
AQDDAHDQKRSDAHFLKTSPPCGIPGEKQAQALDHTLLEVISLLLAMGLGLLFARDAAGRTSFQEMGITPLLIMGIILGAALPFIFIWLELIQTKEVFPMHYFISTGLAFGISLIFNIQFIRQLAKKEVTVAEVFEDLGDSATFVIVGQIFFWMAGIPLLAYWVFA